MKTGKVGRKVSIQAKAKIKFVSVREFIEANHLSRNTVYQGIRDGTIPSIRISKKKILVPIDALQRMLDSTNK